MSNIWRSIKNFATGLLAGFIAALVMTFMMLSLRYLLGLATPAELFGDRIAPTFNPGEFLQLLQQFGGYNELKQAGAGSVLAGQIVVGTLGGLLYANKPARFPFRLRLCRAVLGRVAHTLLAGA